MARLPLRICLVGAGDTVHIEKWSRFLAGRGHSVMVLSTTGSANDQTRILKVSDRKVYGRMAYLLGLPRFLRVLRRFRPNITHIHYLGGHAIYGLLIPRNIAIVASPWGSDIYQMRSAVHTWLVQRLLRKADKVLTTSSDMAQTIHERFSVPEAKIVKHSWGVDTGLFHPPTFSEKMRLREQLGLPKDRVIIFSHRALAPVYRIDAIVNAFQETQKHRGGFFLIILEGPWSTSAVLEYRRRLLLSVAGVGDLRIVKGMIPSGLMADYLRTADVAVSIPISDQRSTSVLEALAAGTQVIASDLAAYRELSEEGFELRRIATVNVGSLATAFEEAATRSGSWAINGQNNFTRICERENWAVQAEKVETEYYRVVRVIL